VREAQGHEGIMGEIDACLYALSALHKHFLLSDRTKKFTNTKLRSNNTVLGEDYKGFSVSTIYKT
jgi:hypothetical protein